MSRGKPCTICTGENVSQVNALLASGIKQKDIAAQFPGMSAFAISRHKRNCLEVAPPPTNSSADPLEQQIGLWLQRSEELYLAGGANLDLRSQGQAISSAFRALEFSRKNQDRTDEKIAANRALPTDGSALTPEEAAKMRDYLDSIIEAASKTSYACPEVRMMGLELAMAKNPELLPVFQRLADDPALVVTVQNLMRGAA
jgi:hypothetical protein